MRPPLLEPSRALCSLAKAAPRAASFDVPALDLEGVVVIEGEIDRWKKRGERAIKGNACFLKSLAIAPVPL